MNPCKKITRFTLLFLLFSCISFASFAQKQWTLEECIQYAIEHNISIQQMELQKENAAIDVNTSEMSRLPNLNSGINQNWSFGRTPLESGLYENQSQSNTSFSISSSIPIFTGFRIPNEIERNKLELKAATEDLERAKEDLALNIASLFLQVLFNKELLIVNEEQLVLSKEQVIKTQSLVEVGKVPKSQLYDIEAQVANDEVSVIQAQNNLKLSLLDLAQSLELEDTESFDVLLPQIDNVVSEFLGSIKRPEVIYNNALEYKPVIKSQEYKIESAEKNLKIAQSGYLPTLSLNMGYGTSYFYSYDWKGLTDKDGNLLNKPFGNQLKNNSNEYIGLSLNIPIFNRFSVRNQVKAARLNINNQQLSLENTKKTLFKEIQTAYLNATAAQEKYHASGRAVKATSESFNYARERYEVGKSSVFEFNEAKTKLVKSQSEEIQAKYDYIFRAKILDFYNGIPITL